MTKKIYTKEDILNAPDYKVIRETGPSDMEDDLGNILNIDEMINQAEKDLDARQSANLNLRWNKQQIERLKRVAKARGQRYQTFVKSILEQVIEAEEKRFGLL